MKKPLFFNKSFIPHLGPLLAGWFLFANVCETRCQAAIVATLVSNYEFEDNYGDSLGNGAALQPLGMPTFNAGRVSFLDVDGLRLDTEIARGDFRIELDTRFSLLSGFHKLIDFQSLTSDNGFYVGPSPLDTNVLRFANLLGEGGIGSTDVVPFQDYTIAIQRFDGVVSVALDGVEQFEFASSDQILPPLSSELYFFVDDTSQFSGEEAIGSIDSIRLYTVASVTAVPEPSLLIVASTFAFGFQRYRQRSSATGTDAAPG